VRDGLDGLCGGTVWEDMCVVWIVPSLPRRMRDRVLLELGAHPFCSFFQPLSGLGQEIALPTCTLRHTCVNIEEFREKKLSAYRLPPV
jgi:hypothetical protein